jgi:hypothetical protein
VEQAGLTRGLLSFADDYGRWGLKALFGCCSCKWAMTQPLTAAVQPVSVAYDQEMDLIVQVEVGSCDLVVERHTLVLSSRGVVRS